MNDHDFQRTLARDVRLSGVGLHTGLECALTLKPAPENVGVIFRRIDLAEDGPSCDIQATADAVATTKLGTELRNGAGASVRTVEHLMAALVICGVDNVLIEMNGPEAPILDGSARDYVVAIRGAGLATQSSPREPIILKEDLGFTDGDRYLKAMPCDRRLFRVEIEFEDPAIGAQSIEFDLDDEAEMDLIAQSRTFCYFRDVEAMQSAGLALGGSMENAIVVDNGRILNPEGLRLEDEFVRHKALDLLGDLALVGRPIKAFIEACKCGHDLNNRFARKIVSETKI